MYYVKFFLILVIAGFVLAACDAEQPETTQNTETISKTNENQAADAEEAFLAKDNLDLQRIAPLLEEADDPQEFEYLLNKDDGINNLDLNGDGYVDYISVAEYEDPDTGARGFSLFDKFGVDDIQEIATIIFDRDRPNRRGARVYIDGNDQIYGEDYFYERDWLDKSMDIANYLFGDRRDDDYYESPYYYDRYPDDYTVYRVVETPVYRTRVTRLYPEPVFVKTQVNPAMTKIMIKSPYHGKYMEKVHAKLLKPTKEQKEFYKNKPKPLKFEKVKTDKDFEREKRRDVDYREDRKKDKPGKPEKPEKIKDKNIKDDKPGRGADKDQKPAKKGKPEKAGKDKGKGKGKDKDKQ